MNAIPARVYVLNSSDAPALKKLLEYDPYLDPNLIPSMPKKWDDKDVSMLNPEDKAEAEKIKKQIDDALVKLKTDRDLNTIFARQDYMLKDGVSVGMDREKTYLYLSADDTFLKDAEPKLKKSIASIQRAEENVEKQIIDTIDKERQQADTGLGLIFGQ